MDNAILQPETELKKGRSAEAHAKGGKARGPGPQQGVLNKRGQRCNSPYYCDAAYPWHLFQFAF